MTAWTPLLGLDMIEGLFKDIEWDELFYLFYWFIYLSYLDLLFNSIYEWKIWLSFIIRSFFLKFKGFIDTFFYLNHCPIVLLQLFLGLITLFLKILNLYS